MTYWIAQFFGVLVAVGAVCAMQLKNKKYIMWLSGAVNIFASINIMLLEGFNSGVIINWVATVQLVVSLYHDRKGTDLSVAEKIVFLAAYIGCGLLGFHRALDLLPIIAVIFYMIAFLQKDEQKLRIFMLGNAATWTVYHGLIGSVAMVAQIANGCSAIVALYRYYNQKKE